MYKYLIIKCDVYTYDIEKYPVYLTNDYKEYNKQGYDIYEIKSNNKFELIREYDETDKEELCVWSWGKEDPRRRG